MKNEINKYRLLTPKIFISLVAVTVLNRDPTVNYSLEKFMPSEIGQDPGTSQPPLSVVVKEAPVHDAGPTQMYVSLHSVPSDGDPTLGHGQLAPDLVVTIALVPYAVPDSDESDSCCLL